MYNSGGNIVNVFGMKGTLIFIGILVVFMLFMYVTMLRPVPTLETSGKAVSRVYKPEGENIIYPYGLNRGFRTPTSIPTAAAYVYTIETPEGNMNYVDYVRLGQQDLTGTSFSVKYYKRGLPPIWTKFLVLEIAPITE